MRSPDSPDPGPPSDRRPAEPSGLIPLQPTHPDDAPTVIKSARATPGTDPSLGLAVGSKLGHFELIEAIGAGGMAAVLKARDTELNRVVALKILPPLLARDPDSVARFKHEARAAAKLDHDNIARVFFCGEDQGLHFIAFELVEGDTLRALIERRGSLPTAECVRYMAQVAAGLAHAAERGVVHRDIKPSNIMITPEGKAKIVDMGLARQQSHSVNGGVTQSGVTLGTFDYISPEQALDPRRADVRSDLYSLGCAFYHALTGRPPVPEGTAAKKLHAHQHEPITDPRVLNHAVSDEMAVVLARMMAKDPAKRFQTPAEVIAALTVVARRLNLASDVMAVDPALLPADPSSVRLVVEPPRMPLGLVVGLAVVAVAVAVLIGMSGSNRGPTKPEWDVTTPGTKATVEPHPPVVPGVVSQPTSVVAQNEQDLIRYLDDPRITEIHLEAGRLYDLSQTKGVSVAAPGRSLTIDVQQSPGKSDPPTLRLAAVAPDSPVTATRPGSLTLAKFAIVRFRGLRFEIAESPVTEDPTARALGLVIADAGTVELNECRFTAHPALEAADVAGLAIIRDGKEPGHTTAKLSHCYLGLRRGAAMQLVGLLKVDVSECGFAPHPAAFYLDDPTDDATPPETPSELTLKHCTFLMDKGAVAEAEDGVRWKLTAGGCMFAAPTPSPAEAMAMPPERPDRRSAIVRMTGTRTDAVRFSTSEPNATFRTDAPADADVIDLKQQSPWELTDPLAALDGPAPWTALRLKATVPQLRRPAPEGIVGVRRLPTETARIYPTWPLPPVSGSAPTARVWWPEVKTLDPEKRPPNTYETWSEAVAALRPGDELLLRFDGELAVTEEQFAKKFPVTVRPYPGSRPVLALDPGERTEPSLFKLMEGELTLDGLEFHVKVKPAPPGEVRTASVVTLVGGKSCTLRNCVVTLEEQADEKAVAVVLADPTGVMMSAADRRPEVRLQRCLVRGKGRGVWVASARPFDLDLSQTVTALTGPVVAIDPAAKPPAAGAGGRVRFDHTTALLAGPLLDLRPGRPVTTGAKPGWVPIFVETERSLFVSGERGNGPLMTIDGGDMAMYGTTFTWGGSGTWYGNFGETGTYLEATTETPNDSKKLAAEEWFALIGEKAEAAGPVRFANRPRNGRPLAAVLAEHLAIRTGAPADTGADVKQVAKPADAER